MTEKVIFDRLENLHAHEEMHLSPVAIKSGSALRRKTDHNTGYRLGFAVDADRILHSRAYSRYIDKTQVFSLIVNDHISHRVLHVQLVSRVARTIGRALYLNEDLIEAIALGHDIGHPPFGHEGETFLSELCQKAGIGGFYHNLQSVRSLEDLEKANQGCNLSLQTLDGILCHDGESRITRLFPKAIESFEQLDRKKAQVALGNTQTPSSLEACVVRIADTIAYLGRDIEDAIVLGLIVRDDIPKEVVEILGNTNGTIIHKLVTDLIVHSYCPKPGETSFPPAYLDFSPEINEALHCLKRFNYREIYKNPKIKENMPMIKSCYHALFEHFLYALEMGKISAQNLGGIEQDPPAVIVRDFIAGMTDDYFLSKAHEIGCTIPQKRRI